MPDYSYSSFVRSGHVYLTRRLHRSVLLKSRRLSAQEALFLGMKEENIPASHELGRWPLCKLSLELKAGGMDLKIDKVQRILKVSFNLYLNIIVALDHLQTGVGERLI